MVKKRMLVAIPLLIAFGYIIDCWITITTTNNMAVWRHYTALILFSVVVYFQFTNLTKALISAGVFLLLGTLNTFSLTVEIKTAWFKIGALETPHYNSLCFWLLMLFIVLNLLTMMNMQLDYKEMKNKK